MSTILLIKNLETLTIFLFLILSIRKVSIECMKKSREYERALAAQIIMLAPFAPHFASELWSAFSTAKHHLIDKNEIELDKDVMEQKWPEIDINYKMAVEVRVSTKCLKYLLFHLYKFYITL